MLPPSASSEGESLLDRYRVLEQLASNEAATTFLAEEVEAGRKVVIKRFSVKAALNAGHKETLSFEGADAHKLVELFEREAGILRQLDHPGIPDFVDYVSQDREDDVELFLVQEHVGGVNLLQADAAKRGSEAEVLDVGLRLARILAYLHGLRPPVVHRDIKPSNVLLREDGEVFLIDFGAVKHRVGADAVTVVGTFGYMPLEQFQGQAGPASDIYALGATLLYLLTGTAPSEIPKKAGLPDFRSMVDVSDGFAAVLDKMLAPLPDGRYSDGEALVGDLKLVKRGKAPLVLAPPEPAERKGEAVARQWPNRLLIAAGLVMVLLVAMLVNALRGATTEPAMERRLPAPMVEPLPVAQEAAEPVFDTVRIPNSDLPRKLLQDVQGHVWSSSHHSAVRFEAGDPGNPVEVFHREVPIYKRFADTRCGWMPFSVAHVAVAPDGELFVLSTCGHLFARRGMFWRTILEEPRVNMSHHPSAMLHWRGQLLVARDGLWAFDGIKDWRNLARSTGTISTVSVGHKDDLLVGWSSIARRFDGDRWADLWRGQREGDRVRAIYEDHDRSVHIGTDDGFVTLGRDGSARSRELRGERVVAFASRGPGRLWVGTESGGLHYREGGLWYSYSSAEGLPSDHVQALLIDRGNRLWCSAGKLLVADAGQAERRIKRLPRVGAIAGQRFDDLEQAAERLLPQQQVSAGVAWLRHDDQVLVFFDGQLVFPGSGAWNAEMSGSRRADGAYALLRRADWSGVLVEGERRTEVPMPEPRPRFGPERVLLDSRGRLWAKAGADDLLSFADGAWQVHEHFHALKVKAMVEDPEGRVWFGTDKARQGTLHSFDGEAWQHHECRHRQYPSGSLAIWGIFPHDGKLLLKHYTSHDAILFDPGQGPLDCNKTQSIGGWDWLSRDDEGRYWLVPYAGIVQWRSGEQTRRLDKSAGLFSNEVVALSHDDRARVWILARNGRVAVYDRAALTGSSGGP